MSGLEQHVRQTQQVRHTISVALLKSAVLRTEMWHAGVTREGLRQDCAYGRPFSSCCYCGWNCVGPPPHTQVCSSPKPWSCERDLIWKYCLQRCNQVNMRSYWIRMDPEPRTEVFKTRNIRTQRHRKEEGHVMKSPEAMQLPGKEKATDRRPPAAARSGTDRVSPVPPEGAGPADDSMLAFQLP